MAEAAGYSEVSVISPRFCVPRSLDFAVSERVWQIFGRGDFVVDDVNGDLMFKVVGSFRSKLILDAAGNPVVTLRPKTFSARSKWQVYKGESKEEKDLIFSARRCSMYQMSDKLHVFLANNLSEDVCDYAMRGTSLGRSCKVYVGDSSTMIAHMQRNWSIGSKFTGKNKFKLTVNQNVDHAFIVALFIIFNEITSGNNAS